MNTIKNIHKLSEIVTPDILVKLDKGANLHLRHANIEFKIISVENTCITIRTVQGKHMSENYADLHKLITVTKNLFESLIPGYNFKVHAIPYTPSDPDIVNAKWINEHMLKYSVRVKDIQDATGIDKTNISAWINEKKPLSQIVKAMFFNIFKVYAINDLVVSLDNDLNKPYYIRTYFDKDLINKLVEKSNGYRIVSEDSLYYKIAKS